MWYSEYYNKSYNVSGDISVQLINKLAAKYSVNNDMIDNKVNQLESEYTTKLEQLVLLCENTQEQDNIFKDLSLNILQKELDIIKLLTKYSLLNNTLNYNFTVKSLKILFDLSETLRIRLGQKSLINDKIIPETITRSSYKFCSYKDNCAYNYNSKDKNMCYQNHYVHNMVSADLNILIKYIVSKYTNETNISHNKDILKTINTLSFVINHMESELKIKCLYHPKSEWNKFHVIKNR
jgi:hypothetical protein